MEKGSSRVRVIARRENSAPQLFPGNRLVEVNPEHSVYTTSCVCHRGCKRRAISLAPVCLVKSFCLVLQQLRVVATEALPGGRRWLEDGVVWRTRSRSVLSHATCGRCGHNSSLVHAALVDRGDISGEQTAPGISGTTGLDAAGRRTHRTDRDVVVRSDRRLVRHHRPSTVPPHNTPVVHP